MHVIIDNNRYDIIINKKRIKHTYIRINDDLKIHVNTSLLMKNKEIEKILVKELNNIEKMIKRRLKKNNKHDYYLLGERFDVVLVEDFKKPEFYHQKLYINDKDKIDSFYKEKALVIFNERLNYLYNEIEEKIPFPKLKIRKMKSRWGVCNLRDNSITLNLELIKRNIKYIDYVIIHELSHFVYFNHSKSFWNLVSKYCLEYKSIRKELRE